MKNNSLLPGPVFIFIYLDPPVAGARQICLARPGRVGAVEMYVLGFSFVIHIVLDVGRRTDRRLFSYIIDSYFSVLITSLDSHHSIEHLEFKIRDVLTFLSRRQI